jgi:hypothetical protein
MRFAAASRPSVRNVEKRMLYASALSFSAYTFTGTTFRIGGATPTA